MALVLVSAAVIVHHSDLSMGSMGGMDHGHGSPAMEMCLGTMAAVGAVVAAVAIVLMTIAAWGPRLLRLSRGFSAVALAAPLSCARAGPERRSLLCVWRH